MELALILRELMGRWRVLALGVVIALAAAILSVYRFHDGKLQARSLVYSSASTQVFVDGPSSALGDLTRTFEPLETRAAVYANFMASPTVLNLIGQKAGIPADQLYAAGPVDPSVPRTVAEPTAVQRNVELTGEAKPYRLNFNDDPNLPTIGIYAQAPTTAQSIKLADASVAALQEYVTGLETSEKTPPSTRVVIRQLGEATGGVVDSGIKKSLALMVFVGLLVLWSVLMLASRRALDAWRASGRVYESLSPAHPGAIKQLDPTSELDALSASGVRPELDAPARKGSRSALELKAGAAARAPKAFAKLNPSSKLKPGATVHAETNGDHGSKAGRGAKAARAEKGNGKVAASEPAVELDPVPTDATDQSKRAGSNGPEAEVARASFRRYSSSRPEQERAG